MFAIIYKKIITDFSKITLFFLSILVIFSLYQSKDFNLDASSDALLIEGDPDLKYLREVNKTYGSKDFLVLTYSPVSSFIEKETILNLQLLKSKIEKLSWVDSVITLIDEIHTPDSSRYFYLEGYEDRIKNNLPQKQLSKEFVRQWLIENGFQGKDGQSIPNMSEEYCNQVAERYIELFELITGDKFIKEDVSDVLNRVEKNIANYLNS